MGSEAHGCLRVMLDNREAVGVAEDVGRKNIAVAGMVVDAEKLSQVLNGDAAGHKSCGRPAHTQLHAQLKQAYINGSASRYLLPSQQRSNEVTKL